VDEHVGTTALWLDKAEALLTIEEFDCALAHCSSFQTGQSEGMRRWSALPIFDRWKECSDARLALPSMTARVSGQRSIDFFRRSTGE
jgi:hypothetical protein